MNDTEKEGADHIFKGISGIIGKQIAGEVPVDQLRIGIRFKKGFAKKHGFTGDAELWTVPYVRHNKNSLVVRDGRGNEKIIPITALIEVDHPAW